MIFWLVLIAEDWRLIRSKAANPCVQWAGFSRYLKVAFATLQNFVSKTVTCLVCVLEMNRNVLPRLTKGKNETVPHKLDQESGWYENSAKFASFVSNWIFSQIESWFFMIRIKKCKIHNIYCHSNLLQLWAPEQSGIEPLNCGTMQIRVT